MAPCFSKMRDHHFYSVYKNLREGGAGPKSSHTARNPIFIGSVDSTGGRPRDPILLGTAVSAGGEGDGIGSVDSPVHGVGSMVSAVSCPGDGHFLQGEVGP